MLLNLRFKSLFSSLLNYILSISIKLQSGLGNNEPTILSVSSVTFIKSPISLFDFSKFSNYYLRNASYIVSLDSFYDFESFNLNNYFSISL